MFLNFLKSTAQTAKYNFKYIILCVIFFTIGIGCGIFFKSAYLDDFFSNNVLNTYLIIFSEDCSLFGFAFKKLIMIFCLLIFILLFGLSPWTLPLHFIIMAYQGFIMSIIVPQMISAFSLSGIVLCVFIVIPCSLLRFASIASFSTLLFARLTKSVECKNNKNSALLISFFISFMFAVIAFLIEIVLIGLIIRPLNIII